MAEISTVAKFVSQKVNKIRWQPTPRQVIQRSSTFASGSWDNGPDNTVSIWQFDDPANAYQFDGYGMSKEAHALEGEPMLLCKSPHRGDVTELQYINQEQILVASSFGGVSIYKHHINSRTLSKSHGWDGLHRHQSQICPCTCVALKGEDTFASVGEDGRLNIVNTDHKTPTRIMEKADSCTLNAVTFLKQSELAAVNTIGQLKVWDIRQSSDEPSRIFLLTGERVPLHCLDKHPTQPHIIATGGQDGSLCIWDMRQDRFPVTLLSAHSSDMWELKFHLTHPDHLFSCSEDGSLWHWDRSGAAAASVTNMINQKETPKLKAQSLTTSTLSANKTSVASPWLSSEASRQGLDITDLLPGNAMSVNTIDVTENTLLCGTDGEQICALRNLVIK